MHFPLPHMDNKKVVLAFSGGLDTSFCVKYLAEERGLEVYTALVQTGGFSEQEVRRIEEHALSLGAKAHVTLDETERYYEQCLKYLVFGNVLRYNTYPLSVSAERMFQAMAIARYTSEIGAAYVAHGSTGAGNDQIRFDMAFHVLIPEVQVITPIRELQLSREAEIEFLRSKGVQGDWTKSLYSINQGLWGTSVGGKETLTSHQPLPEQAWPTAVTATESRDITLHFEHGELKAIDGQAYGRSTEAIQALNALAGPYGIGRDIHVGDTIIGIKGRVGFEAPGPMLIIKAHHALEKHVLTKWQLYWKDNLANWYGMLLHEGQLLDPVMRDIEAFLANTQQTVHGKVFLRLHPYRFEVLGIESEHDLMSSKFGAYGEMNRAWSGEDAKGFAKILSNQTMIFMGVNQGQEV